MAIFFRKRLLALAVCSLMSAAVMAAPVAKDAVKQEIKTVGYQPSQPEVKAFIDDLVKEGTFSRKELESLLEQAHKSDRVLELISRPAESRLEWDRYQDIFLTEQRIREGVEFWQAHAQSLAKAEKEYGVPASVIVAIIGVETYYGRLTGGFRVLDALSTLSFDYPPRSEFFTRQLKEFLILVREQKLEPTELTGSYAGAMGIPQFMPSSYRHFAVDFTGDGQANIWKQEEDAIGSVANYLKENGWKEGKPVASKASVKPSKSELPVAINSVRPVKTIKQLKTFGWKPVESLDANAKAAPLKFKGKEGTEYWLGLENFRVITTYNRSRLYALAVHQLANEVNSGYKTALQDESKDKESPVKVTNKS